MFEVGYGLVQLILLFDFIFINFFLGIAKSTMVSIIELQFKKAFLKKQ